ncbi:hypothetical protein P7K49_012496 [Saguinus oedipus]|uniref:Uncharacterized protein n=1 Tax=Saguinus oedipus TaxID=9490 RepID=A0ABQ9VV71_SAGOE|nr:hypothetical protein P7K49_012496 [Saguinus oedipus]
MKSLQCFLETVETAKLRTTQPQEAIDLELDLGQELDSTVAKPIQMQKLVSQILCVVRCID